VGLFFIGLHFTQENLMSFQKKLIVLAMAGALPMVGAYAQSTAELQKQIDTLKAQMQELQSKSSGVSSEQVNRLELKMDQADDDAQKSGFSGVKIKGVIEAVYMRDTAGNADTFGARSGNGGNAMFEITKETDGGDGVSWTLRLEPNGANLVHEATVSAPLGDGARIYGGIIPDFQGYEMLWANVNPMITHNALYDMAGPASYEGIGMSYPLSKEVALKWMIGNIDGASNDALGVKRTAGLAYRFDWTLSEYSYLGLSGAHTGTERSFNVVAIDGGYVRGDWLLNGHLNFGELKNGSSTGQDATWTGVSALIGYKATPRLQLLARADYVDNAKNGGGIYAYNYQTHAADGTVVGGADGTGLGPELDETGTALDASVGAKLVRLSLGTNYLLNPSTQWKTEVRIDQSSGYNFLDADGLPTKTKTTIGTSIVVAF
jgi:hypothetical protein